MIGLEDTVKVLEGISYLCAIGVLFVAIKGLSQLNIGRKTLSLNSRRDALRIASTEVSSFFKLIMPRFEEASISSSNLRLLKSLAIDKKGGIDFEKMKKENQALYKKYDLNTDEGRRKYTSRTMESFGIKRESFNMLEAFATTFVSGLADEKSAYSALGKAYCNMIDDYVPILTYLNDNGYYHNTLTLHSLWSKRLKKERQEQELRLLEAEVNEAEGMVQETKKGLNSLRREISKIEDEEIISLGADE